MPIRTVVNRTLISLLFGLSLAGATVAIAKDTASYNIVEFNHILDAINQARIPENVKDQLYRDMKTSMIENVREANIPDNIKRQLIQDLESATRK